MQTLLKKTQEFVHRTFNTGPSQEQKISSATKIQSVWRGYKTRQKLKAPKTDHPVPYSAFISGNEPRDTLAAEQKINGYFVYVGNSALRNLYWMKEISTRPVASTDGFTGIPKMYIIDLSPAVVEFWKLLKDIMAKSRTFADFAINTRIRRDQFRMCRPPMMRDSAEEVINNIRTLSLDSSGQVSSEWYKYLRNIVCKASIICEDWDSETTFRYIRNLTDANVPVVVYASNILEYVGNGGDRVHADLDGRVRHVLQNTLMLNPRMAIHTRTSQAHSVALRDDEDDVTILPDTTVILPANQTEQQCLTTLSDARYIAITNRAYADSHSSHTHSACISINFGQFMMLQMLPNELQEDFIKAIILSSLMGMGEGHSHSHGHVHGHDDNNNNNNNNNKKDDDDCDSDALNNGKKYKFF